MNHRLIMTTLALAILTQPSLPALAEQGGISGGGGGVTNPLPATMSQVELAARSSKLLLKEWLNRLEARHREEPSDARVWDLIFNSTPNVFDLIETVQVELRETAPCRDPEGNAVDGSADSQTPNRICISAFNLSTKLTQYNFEYETAALILHEISHLLGANEPEAVMVQRDVLVGIMRHSATEEASRLQIAVPDRLDPVATKLKSLSSLSLPRSSCLAAQELSGAYWELLLSFPSEDFNLNPLRASIQEEVLSMNIKITALQDALCSRDPSLTTAQHDLYAGRYQRGFGSDTHVTTSDYQARVGDSGNLLPPSLVIFVAKIGDEAAYQSELKDLQDFTHQLRSKAYQLSIGRFGLILN